MKITRPMEIGSLCSGYGGLEMAIDGAVRWQADNSPNATIVLKERFECPNLGDITQLHDIEQVDMIVAGFPCQPFSTAGQQTGINDPRSIIDHVARIWEANGAGWLLLENVPGLMTSNNKQDFRHVNQLFERHHIIWVECGADQVGAPHRRTRIFGLVAHADKDRRQIIPQPDSTPPTRSQILERNNHDRPGMVGPRQGIHPYDVGVEWGLIGRLETWAGVVGRDAPNMAERARFREWMMGLPDGWVTDLLPTTKAIEMLGDGVVPQQAAHALKTALLWPHMTEDAA